MKPFKAGIWTATAGVAAIALACAQDPLSPREVPFSGFSEPGLALELNLNGGPTPFSPVATSAVCTAGGSPAQQLVLPPGYVYMTVATEAPGEFLDLADMHTVNEQGANPGRYLYRTHETTANGGVSVTDLKTGVTTVLAQRADWERLDGIVWTPWNTILIAEEATNVAPARRDPLYPNALHGLVYEIDPATGAAKALPAVGSKPHEGMRFDQNGSLYSISETGPGYIYKFVPDHRGDLTSGRLYALQITQDAGDRTGAGKWVPLDAAAVQIDAVAEAAAKGATGYTRPEDVEIGTSTGSDKRGDKILYVAITGEDRVLAVDLRAGPGDGVYVSDYVRDGVNAPSDFDLPDNLALDNAGNLYITEDPGGSAPSKTKGDDVWFAPFNAGSSTQSLPIKRFTTITDCDAEPTGIYLSPSGKTLFVNIQHRGGADQRDLSVAIQRVEGVSFSPAGRQ